MTSYVHISKGVKVEDKQSLFLWKVQFYFWMYYPYEHE